MANTIKLKRGSGSDPSASDLVVGELAIRTDSGKIFTKKDNGSVAEISGGGGIDDGDKGDITVSNGGDTFTIDNGVVTSAKIADGTIVNADINGSAAIAGTKISPNFGSQNIVTTGTLDVGGNATVNRLKIEGSTVPKIEFTDSDDNPDYSISVNDGRFSITDATNSANRFKINTDGHIDIAGNVDFAAGIDVTGNISVTGTVDGRDVATDGTKLDGIESNATADQTASEILTLIKTVDGAGSGLNADLLDGYNHSQFVRSDANDSITGLLTITNDSGLNIYSSTNAAGAKIKFSDQTGQSQNGTLTYKHADGAVTTTGGNSNDGWIFEGTETRTVVKVVGDIEATSNIYGAGANITALNASNISSGTVAAARLDTATTQSAGNSTTKIATTAFVSTAIANLVDSAPGTLNTLNELAAALGDDANFSTTVTNSIATKLPLAGGTMSGDINLDNNVLLFASPSSSNRDHIWSNDTDNSYNFCHDTTRKGTANSILKAASFEGSGASLTSLNASNISSGTINTARLPNTYQKAAGVVIKSTGAGNDVHLDAADHIILEAGEEEDGSIYFRGNSGADSYRFSKGGQHTHEGFLSFESLSGDRTFTFPDTTGTVALTSSNITGNAATATTLATARTIAGVSFDGSANISLNNNAITNGAGYITSADGGNAATLDNLDSTQFLRSDANDSILGTLTVGDGTGQHELHLKKADNNTADHLIFFNGTTRVGEIGVQDTTWLRINQETNKNIYTPRYIRADNGFFVDGTSKGINGSGNFIGGTIAGASDYGTLLRSDTADTASGVITFSAGLIGNVTGNASGSSGSCTGNSATATKLATARTIAGVSFDGSANISLNNNAITNGAGYITGLSFDNLSGKTSGTGDYSTTGDIVAGRGSGSIALTINDGKGNSNVTFNHQDGRPDQNGNAARIEVNTDSTSGAAMYFELKSNVTSGANTTLTNILDLTETKINPHKNIIPNSDSSIDIGSNSVRFANGYFDTLYGDGSNLTGISAGATGGGSDEVFYENDQTVTTNYTITNGKNAMAAGPITINSGVTVTVGSGETLTIV